MTKPLNKSQVNRRWRDCFPTSQDSYRESAADQLDSQAL